MDIKIYKPDESPYHELNLERSHRMMFITASPMFASAPLPVNLLEALPPEEVARQKRIEEAGGVILPEDNPDKEAAQELRAEVDLMLVRHPRMVIEDADEAIVPHREATLILSYPFSVEVAVKITSAGENLTRGEILGAIHDAYVEIYRREDAVSQPLHADDRGNMLNRNKTNGPVGIWGHDLHDLTIVLVVVLKHGDEFVLVPGIEA